MVLQSLQAFLEGRQTFLRLAAAEQILEKVARVSQLLGGNPKFVLLSLIKLSKSFCFLYNFLPAFCEHIASRAVDRLIAITTRAFGPAPNLKPLHRIKEASGTAAN